MDVPKYVYISSLATHTFDRTHKIIIHWLFPCNIVHIIGASRDIYVTTISDLDDCPVGKAEDEIPPDVEINEVSG